MLSPKYLHNFSGVLKIPLINYEINLVLNWSVTCSTYNAAANQAVPFEITDTKLHVPVVTLSTQDNAKLLQQSKSGFKRKTNWNKCQSKVIVKRQNRYSDYLIDPRYQGVNRRFALPFSDCTVGTGYRRCFLPNVQIED